MDSLYTGFNGTLTITDTAVIIRRDTPEGRVLYGDVEPREIPLTAVSGAAYKPGGLIKTGMFRVLVGGDTSESLDGIKSDDPEVITGGGTNFKQFEGALQHLRAVAAENRARGAGFATAPEAAPALSRADQRAARAEIHAARTRATEAAKADTAAKQAAAAGAKLETVAFGGKMIELYEAGYVRVGGALGADSATYEKLRSIKFSFQVQDKSAGGRALAGFATGGLSLLASNEKRTVFLTIATDQRVHTLQETGGMSRGADKRAMKLEAVGQALLEGSVASAVVQATVPAVPASDDLATQIGKLADLHAQGILSDDEFAAAKARLLS